MPALMPTSFTGQIVWLGRNVDRLATLRNEPLTEAMATFAGVEGESRAGLTRPSCSRVTSQYKKGTTIRNVRQFSVVSAEELDEIADAIGVAAIDPAWISASIVIRGIPDFTHIPPASRLQTQDGTTLTVDIHNRPCNLPSPIIDEDAPGHGKAFKTAARDRRGVLAWVEREGMLRVGDTVTLHVPDQRAWAHIDKARNA
jgi:hypothetical protein